MMANSSSTKTINVESLRQLLRTMPKIPKQPMIVGTTKHGDMLRNYVGNIKFESTGLSMDICGIPCQFFDTALEAFAFAMMNCQKFDISLLVDEDGETFVSSLSSLLADDDSVTNQLTGDELTWTKNNYRDFWSLGAL